MNDGVVDGGWNRPGDVSLLRPRPQIDDVVVAGCFTQDGLIDLGVDCGRAGTRGAVLEEEPIRFAGRRIWTFGIVKEASRYRREDSAI